jgi:hypothetical protein
VDNEQRAEQVESVLTKPILVEIDDEHFTVLPE